MTTNWVGRFLCQEVSIFTITLNPTLAYRINDWASIAGGVGLMYASLDMETTVPPPGRAGKIEIDGDDVEVGFNLGLMLDLSERTRLGIIYWSEIEPEFQGDVTINPVGATAGISTALPLVQSQRPAAKLGGRQNLAAGHGNGNQKKILQGMGKGRQTNL